MPQKLPISALPLAVGVGFKSQHFPAIKDDADSVDWFEIHAENYMLDGGPRKAMLLELAKDFPISCHGVGLSIGAPEPLDQDHLARLKSLMDWLQPAVFSEHLAWSTHEGVFFNDLLPLPYTKAVLDNVVAHVSQVQDTLGRQMLIENPSTYVHFAEHEMSEAEFITSLISRSGCGLLLDINNTYVSAQNQNTNAENYLRALPMKAVGEIHLGGHSVDTDDTGQALLIDSHSAQVANPVWTLYEKVIKHYGARPTLIEWDNDVPTWDVMQSEAKRANTILGAILNDSLKDGAKHDQRFMA